MRFTLTEFYRRIANRIFPASLQPNKQWKLDLALSLGLHGLIVLLALITPFFFSQRPPLPVIHTVNLFSAIEIRPSLATQPEKKIIVPHQPETEIVAEKQPATVVTTEQPQPLPSPVVIKPAKTKAVSLRPIPRKNKNDQQKIKQLQEQLHARQQAKQRQKIAQRTTQDAVVKLQQALQAEEFLSDIIRDTTYKTTTTENFRQGSGDGVQTMLDQVTRDYLIAVNNQIQQHWILPNLQNWQKNLRAVIVLRINRDGMVINSFFEEKSDNINFNQFVKKAIREASPLPPFPAEIIKPEMEIGLRFRPGELF